MSSGEIKSLVSTDTSASDGIAAPNPISTQFVAKVAPVDPNDEVNSQKFNTVKEMLNIVGCCSLPDECFDFDSSFVVPGAREEFVKLYKLRDDLKSDDQYPPLSIFGHTDRISEPYYNFQLSRRRAGAIYAVLIRNVDMWEDLIKNPLGNDKWGVDQYNIMLESIGLPPMEEGDDLPMDRKELIGRYMDFLRNDADPLSRENDFLCRGKEEHGKGDVQGCGESNQQFIMSAETEKKLTKEERDEANRRNRRVIAYLFKPLQEMDPEKWPCPHIDLKANPYDWYSQQAYASCKKRFWDKYEERIKQDPKVDRQYADEFYTFACRYYQGIARNSPCEFATRLWVLQILRSTPYLQVIENPDDPPPDPDTGRDVLPGRRFVCKLGDAAESPLIRGRTDERGFLRLPVIDKQTDMDLKVDIYNFANDPALDKDQEKLEKMEKQFTQIQLQAGYLRDLRTGALLPDGDDASEENRRLAAKQRLYNLGYGPDDFDAWTDADLDAAIKKFQVDNNLPQQDGILDEDTITAMEILHEPPRML